MSVRPRREDYFALRQLARHRGVGPSSLLRAAITEWLVAHRTDVYPPAQVPALPEGLNMKFQAGLEKQDKKRQTLVDVRPSRSGLLRDGPT